MTTTNKFLKTAGKFFFLAAVMANAHGAITDIAQGPLVTSSSSNQPVKPNVFLMMDDSGSMGWDMLPDDAKQFKNKYGFYSAQCNGVYYDPSLVNTPPIKADDITHYPDASFTAAPWDGYGIDKAVTVTTNLDTSFVSANYYDSTNYGGLAATRAFYFTYSGTQTTNAQKNYTKTSGTFYQECNSNIGSAPGNAVFTKHILGTTETTTIAISGTSSTSVSSIKVNGVELMAASTAVETSSSNLAGDIANQIHARVATTGYDATASGSTVTITGPTTAADFTPVITKSGSMTLTTDVFPITTASALTNFANWYSYYRTRINMMKSSTGMAFKNIDGNYRVGFATMNNNGGTDLINLAPFIDSTTPLSTQRTDFYAKLYATKVGNSTPLLQALSSVGLMYGHKLPSNKLNTVTANDPIEYSCQQNFAILSTDGYWNDNTNMTLKAQGSSSKCSPTTSSVGNCDNQEVRPMFDGASITTRTDTPTTTVVQTQTVTNYTTTTPWTQTVTTVGGACTVASPPANTTSSYMGDGSNNSKIKVSLSLGATNPAGTNQSCTNLSASGTTKAWICRGTIAWTPGNPPDNNSSVTDSAGTTWFLVAAGSNLGSGCTTDNTAFGSGYSKRRGACPSTVTVSGNTVTTQLQTAFETATGTTTSIDNATTTVTSSVTTINGLAGAPVITTSPTTYSNVSSVNNPISDTTGAYTNTGSPSTSCMATPPAAGTSTPVKGTSSTTGTPTTTTLSTTSTIGTPVDTVLSSTGGTSNTLADVAEYYYVTDIRDSSLSNQSGALGTDVTKNNVPTSGLDSASWQHMTTFTLGLGARGNMVFSPSYKTDGSGDFFAVKNGSLADSSTGVCSWQPDNTKCNWPYPPTNGGDATTIDDLWHAAVDGRGSYYSATNPASLSTGLAAALGGVSARTGSSASASISNPNISSGDNYIFSSSFVTQDWYGRLVRQQLDLNTGTLSPVIDWEAGALLDTNTARNIYAYSSSSGNHLQAFNSANFGSNANFSTPNISSLKQFCVTGPSCLTPAQQTAAAGAPLVSYLIGDRTNEGYPADPTKYYRQRTHLLGDIVDSQASYVKTPLLLYSDAGYADYVLAKANRESMIYVGANDGMLHAFYSDSNMMDTVSGDIVTTGGVSVSGGQEAWAYIPTEVMPNLYQLADIDYASKHHYFVDGSPVASDICPTAPAVPCGGTTSTTTTWKTILVSGLNAGGTSFFAMDITNPAAPKALWEISSTTPGFANLGYSYGNPQIVKLGGTATTGPMAAGTWVVLLTSGYNNADGQGHLYVLNAYSGALLLDISTGVGTPANPSGLAKIVAQVVNPSLNATVLQVYGGDLFGNLWRFDVNGNVGAAGNDAQLLAVLQGPTGLPQPITTKPEVGLVNGNVVVYVGTGRYLGKSDIDGSDTSQLSPNLQSMYGIVDLLSPSTTPSVAIYPDPRTQTTSPFVQQTEFTTTCPSGAPSTVCSFGQIIRTSTNNPVTIPANSGWYLDFPDSGERLNTDPVLELGLLAFNSNVPSASSCSIGGDSNNYLLDYTSGSFPANAIVTISAAMAATLPPEMVITRADGTYAMGVAAGQHTGSLSTSPIPIRLPNGDLALCTNDSTGTLTCRPFNAPPPTGGARRVSWRELLSQ